MNEEIKDLAWEHSQHFVYEKNCSECYNNPPKVIVDRSNYIVKENERIDWGYLEERSAHPEESYW